MLGVRIPTQQNAGPSIKAWVNFNGAGTVSIRDSHNVASVVDLGTGAYRVVFDESLNSANYAVFVGASRTASFTFDYDFRPVIGGTNFQTASSVQVYMNATTGVAQAVDPVMFSVMVVQ